TTVSDRAVRGGHGTFNRLAERGTGSADEIRSRREQFVDEPAEYVVASVGVDRCGRRGARRDDWQLLQFVSVDRIQLQWRGQAGLQHYRQTPFVLALVRGPGQPDSTNGWQPGARNRQFELEALF